MKNGELVSCNDRDITLNQNSWCRFDGALTLPDISGFSLFNAFFFRDFPADVLDKLQSASTLRNYKKNTVIINLGDDSQAAYLIVDGSAYAYTDDENGNEYIVNSFGPGDCFGELGLLDGKPRTAHVVTTTPCECLVIPKADFQRCIFATPEAASATIRSLTGRIRTMTDDVSCLAMLDVYGRIARLIKNSSQETTDGKRVTSRMTHQEIANRIGSSREMVSKIVKDLIVGGYIATDKQKIYLLKDLPERW